MRKKRLWKVAVVLLGITLAVGLTFPSYAKRPNPAEENIVNLSPTSTSGELKIKIKVRDSAGKAWDYTYVPTSFSWDITDLEKYPKGTNQIHGNGTWEYWSEGELVDSGSGSGSININDRDYGKVSVCANIGIDRITIDQMVIAVDGKLIGQSTAGSVSGTWEFDTNDYPEGTPYTVIIGVQGHRTDKPEQVAGGVVYVKRVTTDAPPKVEITGPDSVLSRAPWPGRMPPEPTKVTLEAKGTPSGGKYTWEIIKGGDRIRIVGPTNTSKVTIEGIKGNDLKEDVEVKVTYTIGISSASATHKLTVRRPNSAREFVFLDTMVQEDGLNFWRDVKHTLKDQFDEVILVAGIPIGERGVRMDTFGFAHVGRTFTLPDGTFSDHLESPIRVKYSKWHQTIKAGCLIIARQLLGGWDVGHFYITFDYANPDEKERIKKEEIAP